MDNNYQQAPAQQNGMPPYPMQNGAPMNGMPPYPPQNGMPMNGMPPYPPQNGMPMNGMPMMPPAPRTSAGKTVAVILIAFVGYVVTSLIGGMIAGVVSGITGSDSGYQQMFIASIPEFIFFVGMMIYMKKKKVLTSKGNGFLSGLLIGGFMIYVAVSSLISTLFMTVDEEGVAQYTMPTGLTFGAEQVWATLAILLSAGICEELMFRGIILNALRDCFGRDTFKGTAWAVVVSGVLFGCMHFINLLSGVSLKAVLIQVIAVCGMGMYFGAVYCRSGNIKVTIFMHFLMDICVLLPMSMTDGSDLIESIDDTMASPIKLVSLVVYGGIAAFLMRKSVRHELFTYDLSDEAPEAA